MPPSFRAIGRIVWLLARRQPMLVSAAAAIAAGLMVTNAIAMYAIGKLDLGGERLLTSSYWIMFLSTLVVAAFLRGLDGLVRSILRTEFAFFTSSRLIQSLSRLSYDAFEDEQSHSSALLVVREGLYRPSELVDAMLRTASAVAVTSGLLLGIVSIVGWWSVVPLLFAPLALLVERQIGARFAARYRSQASMRSHASFLGQMVADASWQRELQLRTDDVVGKYYEGLVFQLEDEMRDTVVGTGRMRILWGIVESVLIAGFLAILVTVVFGGTTTTGELTALLVGVTALSGSVAGITSGAGVVLESAHFAEDMMAALDSVAATEQHTDTQHVVAGSAEPRLIFDNVSKSFGNDKQVLRGISAEFGPGVHLITGPNGSGKSTLLRLALGLSEPTTGAVHRANMVSDTAVLLQEPADFLLPRDLAVSLEAHPDKDRVVAALTEAGVEHVASADDVLGVGFGGEVALSGGQWQRIAIARLLYRLPSADLVVIDEPLDSLDSMGEEALLEIVRERMAGKIVLLVSHRSTLEPFVDSTFVLEAGALRQAALR